MREEVAPGLTADWLNGWLAAIGVTVLLPDVQLSWSDEPIPAALFYPADDRPLAERLSSYFEDASWLDRLAVSELPRKVSRDAYAQAAAQARLADGLGPRMDLSLASSVTDLVRDSKLGVGGELPHSPFDPSAPGTTGAVFNRVSSCLKRLDQATTDKASAVSATLAGRGLRVQANGLGFDPRRLPAGVQAKGQVFVDPVVETLCFFGLALFPVRGNGTRIQPRGWTAAASQRGSFTWPVWSQLLDLWAIDALLDRFYSGERPSRLRAFGMTGAFRSVAYRQLDRSDPTRAYASEALPWP
jgi:hypothetical protein